MDQKAFWVGFNHVKGVGAVRIKNLIQRFGDLETAWNAAPQELILAGLTARIVENFIVFRRKCDLPGLWENILDQGIQVIIWEDEEYPKRLKEISQPPPVLYLRGAFQPEDQWAIAVVGTRRMTAYGRQVTEEVSTYLALNHVTVVSGLARGVDAVAHDAVLKNGGRTLAVLGSGVDRIYPPEHERLAARIEQQGAVVSDYAPGTPPESTNFPPRNRIISGLTMATVIIEAGEGSGALITAVYAAEQGREVFAVPGMIHAPQSKGANRLIQEGARPLLRPEDILETLDLVKIPEKQKARAIFCGDEIETKILQVINLEPMHIDEIGAQLGLPIEKVSATLTMLELKGLARAADGSSYTSVRENQTDYGT